MVSAWLFSRRTDLAMFAGSALVSTLVVLLAPTWGVVGETPPWAWLVFVVGIDVAHVWSTVFRVYLDGDELRRRPVLYAGAPLLAYALGVTVHQVSSELFWRVLAYVAVWEAYLAMTHYSFMGQYIEAALAAKRAAGVTGAAYAKAAAQMEVMRVQYANPLFRMPMTFIEIFPVGLLIAIVSAVLLRNPKFLPARSRPVAA